MSEGNLYVLEGSDGVGKTSTAKALANEIGAAFMKTPGPGMDQIREYVHSDMHSPQTEFLYNLASTSAVSDHIEDHLNAGNDIVLDRYYPTTIAYRNAETGEDWTSKYTDFDFAEPDEMFYLWTDEETRMERISARGIDKDEEVDSDFMMRVREEYEHLAERFDMTSIESAQGVDNVVNKILDRIENKKLEEI